MLPDPNSVTLILWVVTHALLYHAGALGAERATLSAFFDIVKSKFSTLDPHPKTIKTGLKPLLLISSLNSFLIP